MIASFPTFLEVYQLEAGCENCTIRTTYLPLEMAWELRHNDTTTVLVDDSAISEAARSETTLRAIYTTVLRTLHHKERQTDGQ